MLKMYTYQVNGLGQKLVSLKFTKCSLKVKRDLLAVFPCNWRESGAGFAQ